MWREMLIISRGQAALISHLPSGHIGVSIAGYTGAVSPRNCKGKRAHGCGLCYEPDVTDDGEHVSRLILNTPPAPCELFITSYRHISAP